MMLNDRIPLQIGGFHDHWLRNGTDNATLLAAAAQYYHYDFICLMDGFRREVEQFRQTVESWAARISCISWGRTVLRVGASSDGSKPFFRSGSEKS